MSTAMEEVPFYLMPLAAVLGMYSVAGGIRLAWVTWNVLKYNKEKASGIAEPPSITQFKSRAYILLLASVLICVVGYGAVVGKVQSIEALASPFNPYEVLSLPEGCANSTLIKSTYRSLSKVHHPDKTGGKSDMFQLINMAYRTLTDEKAFQNWQTFGHPDGARHGNLSFALPDWLLHPEGTTAGVLVLMYLGLFGWLIWVVVNFAKKTKKEADVALENTVSTDDISYLIQQLQPDSSPMDILFMIATTPENLQKASDSLKALENDKKRKREFLKEQISKQNNFDMNLDEGPWADDDDEEDEEAKQAQQAMKKLEEQRKKEKADLARTTGKVDYNNIKIEGLDGKVIGPKWVQSVLEEKSVWPPSDNTGVLHTWKQQGRVWTDHTTSNKDPLKVPSVHRNLLHITARLNAQLLNNHPDFAKLAREGLLDSNHYKYSMEFRQRTGLLLEAALRVACSNAKNYQLAKNIIQTVSIFKIGVPHPIDETKVAWFHNLLKQQYGIVPKLTLTKKELTTLGEDEIATGDTCTLQLSLDRAHAENFLRAKIAMAEKQGIPPQALLQTYREGWWLLVRAEKIANLDGTPLSPDSDKKNISKEENDDKKDEEDVASKLDPKNTECIKQLTPSLHSQTLVTAWPMICTNVAQKSGQAKIRFQAPAEPGKYKFHIDVVSQEFLGVDDEFSLECDILDVEEVNRKQQEGGEGEDEEKNEEEEESETKKDK